MQQDVAPTHSPNPNPWICTHPGLPAIRGYSLAHPCPAVYLSRTAGIRANPKSQQRRPANGTENSARGTMQTGEDLAPALQCARPQWVCLDRGLLSLRRGRSSEAGCLGVCTCGFRFEIQFGMQGCAVGVTEVPNPEMLHPYYVIEDPQGTRKKKHRLPKPFWGPRPLGLGAFGVLRFLKPLGLGA